MFRPTTEDQEFFCEGNRLRAIIDVEPTREDPQAPSVTACRHAVLGIVAKDVHGHDAIRYVVYDRLLSRIVNGVYLPDLAGVLLAANDYNTRPCSPQDMAPNGLALGLHYPVSAEVEGEEHHYELQ